MVHLALFSGYSQILSCSCGESEGGLGMKLWFTVVTCVCCSTELQRAKEEVRKEQQRRQKDKTVGESLKEWGRILPNWEAL